MIIKHTSSALKTYQVKNCAVDFTITGRGDNPAWINASMLTNFIYPWENEEAPYLSFQALHTRSWLYCLFRVKDKNVNVFFNTGDKTEVVNSDRVELFLRQNQELTPYYCLELDPQGRILDYQAEFYRKFDMNWSWPKNHLLVKTDQQEDGYTVEIAISKESLKQLGLLKDGIIQAGLFRGKCISIQNSNATMKWMSWVRPDSKNPDFHIPSSFGVLNLGD